MPILEGRSYYPITQTATIALGFKFANAHEADCIDYWSINPYFFTGEFDIQDWEAEKNVKIVSLRGPIAVPDENIVQQHLPLSRPARLKALQQHYRTRPPGASSGCRAT